MNLEKLLVEEFQVSTVDLEKAKNYQQRFGGRLEQLLVNMGSLSEDALPNLFSSLLSVQLLTDIDVLSEDYELPEWAAALDVQYLVKHSWLPLPENAHFICADPFDWEVNQYLLQNDYEPQFSIASKDLINGLIAEHFNQETAEKSHTLNELEEDRLRELASEAPTVNLLNSLIAKGLKLKASDLHLEPVAGRYRIRYRVDGVLNDDGVLPSTLSLPVISRIKILSNMDIAEKRRPQDGKIETKIANIELDIRVSALPLNKGESVVLRFLRKDSVTYDMDVLGISPDIRQKISQDLKSTAGVILLTGPTGSGKTTSLYTFLNELNSDNVKIITLEDPVEYQLEGINQVQVNSEIGFDFAAGLRSIVRQDPDIIMLGEIRDQETARIAMQSALTGHLVFSTVHTNDAPSAYTRLVDLGVEEFLLNAAIISVMAQRLVRKVCPHCAVVDDETELHERLNIAELLAKANIASPKFVKAVGCEHCDNNGYKGRMSIMEYLPCDDAIRAMDKDSYFIPEARAHNKASGNRTLLEDGLLKASQGLTTIDEVLRVCS
ncbi:GspE/PulE family protein [Planctobacterium marinum]|uniref:GspE/PulE family protein n=1 Tax=Planctobacterium marinum TaxID=1631968 RepID=UPI001E4D588A|nr:ATPase, T2SS/T4P/T4SS family [Planctobacterium marinum]MCC2606160.1 type II/IV secretion system protein [Planctobacterium marinum]